MGIKEKVGGGEVEKVMGEMGQVFERQLKGS